MGEALGREKMGGGAWVVVGARGALGALLVEKLGATGLELRSPIPRSPDASSGDARIPEVFDASLVINASGPRVRSELGWADYFREHVGTSARIARSMRPGAHLVHISSTAVFGARRARIDASTPEAPTLFPSPAYACAKLAAEAIVRAICHERAVSLSVVRPSMIYGPGIDSALETIRRLSRRGIGLRLTPRDGRQHLVHFDVVFAAISRLVQLGPLTLKPLILADPFVLTNRDIERRSALALTVPVRDAASFNRGWQRVTSTTPPSLVETLAVLGLDNTFDAQSAFSLLKLDAASFRKSETFDPYWNDHPRSDVTSIAQSQGAE